MNMKITTAVVIFMGSIMLVRADQLVESVQQALKDQGFYYGEVTGEMNANLAAAIRRYQIRNGLQVSGQLNTETLQSLGIESSASAPAGAKPGSPSPAAPTRPGQGPADETTPPAQVFGNAPQDQQVYPSNPVAPGASKRGTGWHPIRGCASCRATQRGVLGPNRTSPARPLS